MSAEVTLNDLELVPASMDTLWVASSAASVSCTSTGTVSPPVGAFWSRLTVQEKVPPSLTDVGQEVSVATGVDCAVVVEVKSSASASAPSSTATARRRADLSLVEGLRRIHSSYARHEGADGVGLEFTCLLSALTALNCTSRIEKYQ